MTTPMLAEVRLFAGNFAPRGWMFCYGQILSIAQNTALFSLLGTTYGGNGQTTFALPDLRGRVPRGTGQGPGLDSVNLGEMAGSPTHTLIITEMPAHNHTASIPAASALGTLNAPAAGTVPAASNQRNAQYAPSGTADVQMAAHATGISGGSQPFSIMPPYVGLNYIIAVEGVYPSRN